MASFLQSKVKNVVDSLTSILNNPQDLIKEVFHMDNLSVQLVNAFSKMNRYYPYNTENVTGNSTLMKAKIVY